MGLPGVQQVALARYSRAHEAPYFAGADFYLDGINYAQRIVPRDYERRIENASSYTRHEQASLLAEREIQNLERLKPRKIVAVFDAMVDKEKFAVRMARAEARLRTASVPMSISEILAERMAVYHKHIVVIYSGSEAEAEIMKLIDEDASRAKRRQFVFTGDSDVYRFNIRNQLPVEIVPHMRQGLNKGKRIRTVKLQVAVNLVEESMRIYPLIERPGKSTMNPRVSSRKLLEFINCGHAHHLFFISHGPLLIKGWDSAPQGVCPFDAGRDIRRAAYGLIMEVHFAQRPDVDTSKVEEWLQHDMKMIPEVVYPLAGEELRQVVQQVMAQPLSKIIDAQLRQVSAKYAIEDAEIVQILQAASHLSSQQLQEPVYPVSEQTGKLFLLVKGIVKSLFFLNEVSDVKADITDFDQVLSAGHFQAYLQNLQEADVDFQDSMSPVSPNGEAGDKLISC